MNENEKPQNDELYQIQLATARVEYELKKLELANKPGRLSTILKTPAFLATVVTALITLAIAGLSQLQAYNQRNAEETRYNQELNKSILLGIVNPGEPAL